MSCVDMSITSQRQKAVDFAMPYMNTGKIIFQKLECKTVQWYDNSKRWIFIPKLKIDISGNYRNRNSLQEEEASSAKFVLFHGSFVGRCLDIHDHCISPFFNPHVSSWEVMFVTKNVRKVERNDSYYCTFIFYLDSFISERKIIHASKIWSRDIRFVNKIHQYFYDSNIFI